MLLLAATCFWLHEKIDASYLDKQLQQEKLLFRAADVAAGFYSKSEETMNVDYEIYDNDLDTLPKIAKQADAIVIGNVLTQAQDGDVFRTEFRVTKAIKGDVSNSIIIFEPCYIEKEPAKSCFLELKSGYMPMNKEKQYLLFLKQEKIYQKPSYHLVSNYYGKFPYGKEVKVCRIKEGQFYSYQKYKTCDDFEVDMHEKLKVYQKEYDKNKDTYIKEEIVKIQRYVMKKDKYDKIFKDVYKDGGLKRMEEVK